MAKKHLINVMRLISIENNTASYLIDFHFFHLSQNTCTLETTDISTSVLVCFKLAPQSMHAWLTYNNYCSMKPAVPQSATAKNVLQTRTNGLEKKFLCSLR